MSIGIKAYQDVQITNEILSASPHRIIQMLMQSFLDRCVIAKSMMIRHNYAQKSYHCEKAINLLEELLSIINYDEESDIPNQLSNLYQFMLKHLWEASLTNDPQKMDDLHQLMSEIKLGWDAIPDEIKINYNRESL